MRDILQCDAEFGSLAVMPCKWQKEGLSSTIPTRNILIFVAYSYIHIYIRVHTCTYMCNSVFIHMCNMCMCIYICMYLRISIYIYIYTYCIIIGCRDRIQFSA